MNNYSAIDWFKAQFKNIKVSNLGENVVNFLDKMWGIHNCNRTSLSKVDWSNDTWIEVTIDKQMSTVDNNDLTRLVVIAHQMMLRIEMKGLAPGYIKLVFHQRTKRNRENGNFWNWCPYIEDHVKEIVKYHPTKEQVL